MLWGSISLAVVSISRPRNLVGYSKNYILEKDLHPSFIHIPCPAIDRKKSIEANEGGNIAKAEL
jgi:hypothetical protein